MGALTSQIASLAIVYSIGYLIQENIKAPRHWPLCGEFTGDRWIPRAVTREMFPSDHVIMTKFKRIYTASPNCSHLNKILRAKINPGNSKISLKDIQGRRGVSVNQLMVSLFVPEVEKIRNYTDKLYFDTFAFTHQQPAKKNPVRLVSIWRLNEVYLWLHKC